MLDYNEMSFSRVVVDGSNIATEGRSAPSLSQLDEAVREFQREHPDVEVIVVVDATFGHRIDSSERPAFDEAQAHGELVSPPAGAIGRGDAFLLRIADKSGATVLSNDSFQEFHGEYDWLFTKGRLIGGKPIPGVGWIFTPRNPVRGPRSRESVRDARRSRVRVGSKEASQPMPVPKAPPPRAPAGIKEAIATATEEVVTPRSSRRRRRRGPGGPPPEAVNDPLTFINFVAAHPLGSELEGEVDSFSSHGAFVTVDGARCYIPLSALGSPPPRSARQVLDRGDRHTFVLQALDPPRRGIELALPGFEHVSGTPQEETVEAEIESVSEKGPDGPEPAHRAARSRRRRAKAAGDGVESERVTGEEMAPVEAEAEAAAAATAPVRKSAAQAPARGRTAASKAATRAAGTITTTATKAGSKAAAKKAATGTAAKAQPAKKATTKKAATKQTATKQTATKKAPAKKAAATRKAATEQTAARKTAARKTAAKKAATTKAPAKKAATTKAATKKASTKKAATRKAATKEAAATTAPGREAAAGEAPAAEKATRSVAKKAQARKTTSRASTGRTAARRGAGLETGGGGESGGSGAVD